MDYSSGIYLIYNGYNMSYFTTGKIYKVYVAEYKDYIYMTFITIVWNIMFLTMINLKNSFI